MRGPTPRAPIVLSLALLAPFACKGKDAPAVAANDPATSEPSSSTSAPVPSTSASAHGIATSLDALTCTDGDVAPPPAPNPEGFGYGGLGLSSLGPGGVGSGIGLGAVGGMPSTAPSAKYGVGLATAGASKPADAAHIIATIADAPLPLADPLARAICPRIAKVRACYEALRTTDPTVTGDVTATIAVDDAKTVSAKVIGVSGHVRFGVCAGPALDGLVVPSDTPAGTAKYTITFATTPRRAKVLEAGITLKGGLPAEVVRRIVRANFPRYRACYESGLKRDPSLAGTIATHFVIDSTGAVVDAKTSGGTLTDKSVVACVNGVFKTLSFPEPESSPVDVDFSIAFSVD